MEPTTKTIFEKQLFLPSPIGKTFYPIFKEKNILNMKISVSIKGKYFSLTFSIHELMQINLNISWFSVFSDSSHFSLGYQNVFSNWFYFCNSLMNTHRNIWIVSINFAPLIKFTSPHIFFSCEVTFFTGSWSASMQ